MHIFFLDKDFIYLRRLISRLDEWEVLIFSSNSRQECEWVCFPKCQTLYFFYMAVLVILLCYIPFSYSSCHSNALQHPITLCMCTNTHTPIHTLLFCSVSCNRWWVVQHDAFPLWRRFTVYQPSDSCSVAQCTTVVSSLFLPSFFHCIPLTCSVFCS